MNLFINRNRLTGFENKFMVIKGEMWGEGKIWSLGLTHTTICKIDTNKNLLYNTGNSIQYVITYGGKESKRIDICTEV